MVSYGTVHTYGYRGGGRGRGIGLCMESLLCFKEGKEKEGLGGC